MREKESLGYEIVIENGKKRAVWISGRKHPKNSGLIADSTPENWKCVKPGYVWTGGAKTEWRSGLIHPENSNLKSICSEGEWKCIKPGYVWTGGAKTEWRSGLIHPENPNLKSAYLEGTWKCIKLDYEWVGGSNIERRKSVQLWKDGPYWATKNIGAQKPEDYGYYFWWGDIVGYKRVGDKWVASDGSSFGFSFDEKNVSTSGKSIFDLYSEGRVTKKGWIITGYHLTLEHDAAHVHWGGAWRMPILEELKELNSKCDWKWTTVNGVNGFVVSGKNDFSSASIFLPCAGSGYKNLLRDDVGSYGHYWSSVPYENKSHARNFYFLSCHHAPHEFPRFYGNSIRPVQGGGKYNSE